MRTPSGTGVPEIFPSYYIWEDRGIHITTPTAMRTPEEPNSKNEKRKVISKNSENGKHKYQLNLIHAMLVDSVSLLVQQIPHLVPDKQSLTEFTSLHCYTDGSRVPDIHHPHKRTADLQLRHHGCDCLMDFLIICYWLLAFSVNLIQKTVTSDKDGMLDPGFSLTTEKQWTTHSNHNNFLLKSQTQWRTKLQ